MSDECPFGKELQKYWDRLSLKEKKMSFDEEGLYSFTPLTIGFQLARQIKSETVYDCFSGVGGLGIAFACAGKQVHGIELNAHRVQMAKANAKLFDIEEKIDFVCGDSTSVLLSLNLRDQAVVLDPPWGGTAYRDLPEFKLNHFRPEGEQLLFTAFKTGAEVMMILPKNFDMKELARFKKPHQIIENILNGELLSYAVLFPPMTTKLSNRSGTID